METPEKDEFRFHPIRLFISCAIEDDNVCSEINSVLAGCLNGATIFYHKVPGKIKPGEENNEFLKNEVNESNIFVSVVSNSYFISPSCANEVDWAKSTEQITILPIVVGDTALKERLLSRILLNPDLKNKFGVLAGRQWVTASDLDPLSKWVRDIVDVCEEKISEFQAQLSGKMLNPFMQTIAEMFNPHTFSRVFTKPSEYDSLTSRFPTIIEGARGSGKTMLLRSLMPLNQAAILQANDPTFKNVDLYRAGKIDFISIYMRRQKGKGYEAYQYKREKEKIFDRYYMTEFVVDVLDSLLKDIGELVKSGIFGIHDLPEFLRKWIGRVTGVSQECDSISDARDILVDHLKKLREFLSVEIISMPGSGNTSQFPSLELELIESFFTEVRSLITELKNKDVSLYILIDEYENLAPFQMEVINTLFRKSTVVIPKVARKRWPGGYTNNRIGRDRLSEGNDYVYLWSDFSLISKRDNFGSFRSFAQEVCSKYFAAKGYSNIELQKLLGKDPTIVRSGKPVKKYELQAEIENEFDAIRKKRGRENNRGYDVSLDEESDIESRQDKGDNLEQYYKIAAESRVIKKNHLMLPYNGLDAIAKLSDGIIRTFLQIIQTMMKEIENAIKSKSTVPAVTQNKYVLGISQKKLSDLDSGREEVGKSMGRLVRNLGKIFEYHLLNMSEPQVIAATITEKGNVPDLPFYNEVIEYSVRENVLIETQKAGKSLDLNSKTYRLNRIFCPVLKLDYRDRWRISLTSEKVYKLMKQDIPMETLNAEFFHKELEKGKIMDLRSFDERGDDD